MPVAMPHPNCYAVPGHNLLAGEYPFLKDPAAGRGKLRQFLDAGVTFFVDVTTIQDDMTPYEHVLNDEGARTGRTIGYARLPIRDNDVPTVEEMVDILDTIDQALEEGHRVYVHCWGGVGRTGTVVGCFLVRHGMDGEDALKKVGELFGTMSPEKVAKHRSTGSPQTEPQREFIRTWSESEPRDDLDDLLDEWFAHPQLKNNEHLDIIPRSYRLPGTRIFIGEHPLEHYDGSPMARIQSMVDEGITGFLRLVQEGGDKTYGFELNKLENEQKQALAFPRYAVLPPHPTQGCESSMATTLDSLDELHREGHAVYVHANGVGGRLSAFVACHRIRGGWSAEEALEEVERIRSFVEEQSGYPVRPLSSAWKRFVRKWSEGESEKLMRPTSTASRFLRDQMRGAILGLAVGDALGTAVEFKKPGTFRPVTGMVGGGPFGLNPGEWTDDTSMALCLAESLIENREFEPADQMKRYVRWWKEGHLSSTGTCFDCGNTVAAALGRFQRTGDPYSGSTAEDTAGNGSLMRLAPVPVFCFGRALDAVRMAAMSSRTTHATSVAVDACRYLAALITGALSGATKQELVTPPYNLPYETTPGYWEDRPLHGVIAEIAAGSFKGKEPPEIRGTGYAADALEAALWAFHRSSSFEEGALLAVNLGDDADTTAAIYGQLAGAFYGERGIPPEWRARLARKDLIDLYAESLFQLSFAGHSLSPARRKGARASAEELVREHGSVEQALRHIAELKAQEERELSVMERYSGSLAGAAVAEEVELQLRIMAGVEALEL